MPPPGVTVEPNLVTAMRARASNRGVHLHAVQTDDRMTVDARVARAGAARGGTAVHSNTTVYRYRYGTPARSISYSYTVDLDPLSQ